MDDADEPRGPCVVCGGTEWIPIAYGLPGPEMEAKAEREEVILGGCLIFDDAPTHACRSCGSPTPAADGFA